MSPHEDADVPIFLQLVLSKEINTNSTGGERDIRNSILNNTCALGY